MECNHHDLVLISIECPTQINKSVGPHQTACVRERRHRRQVRITNKHLGLDLRESIWGQRRLPGCSPLLTIIPDCGLSSRPHNHLWWPRPLHEAEARIEAVICMFNPSSGLQLATSSLRWNIVILFLNNIYFPIEKITTFSLTIYRNHVKSTSSVSMRPYRYFATMYKVPALR